MATQSQFTQALADELEKHDFDLGKKDVEEFLGAMATVLTKEMKKKDEKDKTKFQTVPVKFIGRFRLNKTPARKARKGISPFTKEEMVFKAKPAGKKAKFTLDKSLRDALGSK